MLVASGNPRKKEFVDTELACGRISKSYCMNFDSFKIVDSSLC